MRNLALPPPSNDVVEYVRAATGVNENRIKEAVNILKNWVKLQPHLPHDYDEGRLERRYMWCKASMERTKSSLDMYYTLRNAVPDILSNRDPFSPWFSQITSLSYCLPLPRLTEECYRVVIIGNLDPDATNYNLLDVFKIVFMVGDVRLSEDCCLGDIYIVDLANFGLGHMAKITITALKKLEVCAMKGYSARIKAIHYLNVPPYADMIINLMRSVMKPKIAARMHIHTKGTDSLHDKISKHILPHEYGGEAGSLSDLWGAWKEKLESYRQWFLEQDTLKAEDTKRPGKKIDSGEIFGFEGSFRQLEVD